MKSKQKRSISSKKRRREQARRAKAVETYRHPKFNLNDAFLSFATATRQQIEQMTVTLRQLCQQTAELKEPFSQQSVLGLHAPIASLNDAIQALRNDIKYVSILPSTEINDSMGETARMILKADRAAKKKRNASR